MNTNAVSKMFTPLTVVLFVGALGVCQANPESKSDYHLVIEDSENGFLLCIDALGDTEAGKWIMQQSTDLKLWEEAGAMSDQNGVMVYDLAEEDISTTRFYRAVFAPTEALGGATEVDPAEVDPAEVDPAEVDPAEVDPAEVDPAEVDPAEVDPVEGDPVEGDPAEGDPAEGDPAEGDPAEGDPAEGDPAEVDPAGVEVGGAAQDDLNAARGLWQQQELSNYGFDLYSNFSLFVWQGHVTVQQGVASGQRTFGNVDDNSEVRTIDQLFELIQGAIDRSAEVINVIYNADQGYPESAFFDFTTLLADEERAFSVSNLIAVPIGNKE